MVKAVYKILRKSGGLHLSLGLGNVIDHAVALDGKGVSVKYRVAGTRVAVAGLADAARVDDQPLLAQREDLILCEGFEFGEAAIFGADKGYVRVTDKAVPGREHPNVARAALASSRYSSIGWRRLPWTRVKGPRVSVRGSPDRNPASSGERWAEVQ